MRVDKKFAPLTLTIETEEDKHIILNILEAAYRKRTEHWFGRTHQGDKLVSQIEYLMEKLR